MQGENVVEDLISRSALIEILTKYKFGAISNESEREYTKETVLQFVKEQPTTYNVDRNVLKDLLAGKWVETEKVQNAFGMTFKECFEIFEFSRTAEWWSIVGKTEEERQRNGQKISTCFRVKVGGVNG